MRKNFSFENSENPRTISDVLRDLRHIGFRSGYGERSSLDVTRDLFDQLAKALQKEGAPPNQPPIAHGFSRLYRGEPATGDFPKGLPPIGVHPLSDQYGEQGGRWFGLDVNEAAGYAGNDGIIYYVDVPIDSLIQYEAINFGVGLPGEFIIPESVVNEKRVLPRLHIET